MPRTTTTTTRRRAAEPASTKQAISNFTRVSKGLSTIQNVKDIKPVQPTSSSPASSKKRKVEDFDDENVDPNATTLKASAPIRAVSVAKRQKKTVEVAVPVKSTSATTAPVAQQATPKKNINTELKWPACSTSKPSAGRRSTINDGIAKTKQQGREVLSKRAFEVKQTKKEAAATKAKRTAKQNTTQTQQLPPALLELVEMHAAFLRTLVMHLAHSSSATPIDVRALAPDVSRAWGKRNVTIEDLRRCLAIQSHGASEEAPFLLTDYGRGKICIEKASSMDQVNEKELNKQFTTNLMALYTERADDVDIYVESLSIADLPQAPITSMKVSLAENPLLAKGHHALMSLKNDIATKTAAPTTTTTTTPEPATTTTTTNTAAAPKLSLLDRLRLKQLAKSAGPAPPTGPEMDRRAALQRVADVADVISNLTLLKPLPRQAYPMAQLVERLHDSLRTPISGEEAARCVHLLAEEVTPGWVKILTVGGKEQVIIQKALQPVDQVIRETAQALGA
jgi:hypothetical protein